MSSLFMTIEYSQSVYSIVYLVCLIRNTETLLWDLQKAETELWKEPPEPLLDEIAELVMKDNPYWEGSPTVNWKIKFQSIHPKTGT